MTEKSWIDRLNDPAELEAAEKDAQRMALEARIRGDRMREHRVQAIAARDQVAAEMFVGLEPARLGEDDDTVEVTACNGLIGTFVFTGGLWSLTGWRTS